MGSSHQVSVYIYLIFLSSLIAQSDSVCDTDGEILLIEAANELPSWVKPSNAENRVRLIVY